MSLNKGVCPLYLYLDSFDPDITGKVMLTLNIDYEVLPDRVITIKLPESVRPGRHELVIVVEENETAKIGSESNAEALMEFAPETMKEFKMPETCPMTASGIFLKNGQQAMILSGKLAHYSA
ncbi:MAG: hypothetical protein WAW61_16800, partial [Methylococcaceae bacterium]